MSNLCSDSVLTGQEGTILFTPPGTSACVRDFSAFSGDRIYVPCGSSFVVGDQVTITEEDGGNADTNFPAGDYYVVAVGVGASGDTDADGNDMEGVPYIKLSSTEGGAAITAAGDGGVATAGVLTTGGMGTITAGSGGTDGTYENVKLTTSGSGTGAEATITVASSEVTGVTITKGGSGYAASDTISAADADIGNTTGFSQAITSVSSVNSDSPLPAHINIALSEYFSVCGVRDFSIDISRDELDVTTLPCAENTAKGCEDLAEFRKTQAGYASATGSMTVYFTCDQANISNRLLSSSIAKSQQGAKVKLYVCATYEGGALVDSKSLFVEAEISITGLSFSVNPDDATTAELSFGVRKMVSMFGKT